MTSSPLPRVATGLLTARTEAAQILWNLAYNNENKQHIQELGGVQILSKIRAEIPEAPPAPLADDIHTQAEVQNEEQNEYAQLKKNVEGALWLVDKQDHTHHPTSDRDSQHVMISYNWGVQPIVKKIAAALQQLGYKVWLDLEQMKGSTLDAMADAVENAAVVLICMTEKYKDSPNCRLEGEYTNTTRKPFIPLMLQSNYKPTGWLGLMLGARLWHAFFNEEQWDDKITQLKAEIGDRGKSGAVISTTKTPPPPSVVVAPTPPAPLVPALPPLKAAGWGVAGVGEWLVTIHLPNLAATFGNHNINGVCLCELRQLLISGGGGYSDFYTVFKTFGVDMPLADALTLAHHLRNLS